MTFMMTPRPTHSPISTYPFNTFLPLHPSAYLGIVFSFCSTRSCTVLPTIDFFPFHVESVSVCLPVLWGVLASAHYLID